jgi:hypothetical protein
MLFAAKCAPNQGKFVPPYIDTRTDARIRAFLAGESHGEELLHAIYDHVLDEPVPERLRAVLKP